MELTLLTVADCPHAAVFEERLAVALVGHGEAASLSCRLDQGVAGRASGIPSVAALREALRREKSNTYS